MLFNNQLKKDELFLNLTCRKLKIGNWKHEVDQGSQTQISLRATWHRGPHIKRWLRFAFMFYLAEK